MSTITIAFDKPRTLTYRWTDLRVMSQRLGGCSLVEIVQKLGESSPDSLHVALLVGLSHDDKRLTGQRLDDMIQSYIDKGGKLHELGPQILEAMMDDGLLYSKKEDAPDAANPTES